MKNASNMITLLLLFAVGLLFAGCASFTPLMEASMKGDTKDMERLIAAGANVNEESVYAYTALHYAVYKRQIKAARLLIKNGADVNKMAGIFDDALVRNPSVALTRYNMLCDCTPL